MTVQELKQVKNGDFLTTKYGSIIAVQRVEITFNENTQKHHVSVYPYFDYDPSGMGLSMNDFGLGFYGPKFDDEDFYRPSTEEEKQLILDKIKQRGYIWDINMFIMTPEEHHRILKLMGECPCGQCEQTNEP